jgi:flagellar hook-length control protein FliK
VTDSTFQRLDSGEAPATLLHASAREVAVGVRDPSLGWVEIQTQSSGGHVSASLTAASAEAHASLTIAAPAISQYLQDRNVHIHNLDVSMQSGPESGGRQQSNSGGAEQEVSRQGRTSSPQNTQPMRKTADDPGALEAGRLSRISVRA